ncbi:MAG TPA: hypothetical protein VKD71_11565 [Gemmataceae bacterium]|nr:hypothetical protein [Gemmataceae bacterium]
MPENYALYTRSYDLLPQAKMEVLADGAALEKAQTERGVTYTYRWPDLTIIVSEMPANQLSNHLRGFEGYINQHIYKGEVPRRGKAIIRTIRATRLVVGVEFQPGHDKEGRAELLLGRMSGGLHPIIFHADALFDWTSRLLLAPDGSFDPGAEVQRPWWKFWQ